MSVLSDVFSPRTTFPGIGAEDEEYLPRRQWETARPGYDPRSVKSFQEKIREARSDDERILLAAQLAHSRSSGRHLGPPVTVDYVPWQDDGYDYPARNALAWLLENGRKYGVILRPIARGRAIPQESSLF